MAVLRGDYLNTIAASVAIKNSADVNAAAVVVWAKKHLGEKKVSKRERLEADVFGACTSCTFWASPNRCNS
jgi:replication initiation and membrane attachment protein DnaB